MGYMIGMPCLKLNNVGGQSKKCGDFGSVAREALEERQGRDKDIDKSKADENVYTGYRTAAELQEYSRNHIEELSAKQKAAGGRKIRNDAVVMIATVIKPPAALMSSLSKEEQNKLLDDSLDKLAELVGKENIKSTSRHFDEQGGHVHVFWEPMTDDGRLCAKEKFNLVFFNKLNQEMPAHLRARGWDMIDDCQMYDAAKEMLRSEEEKAAERKNKGLTSVQYKAQAEARKNELCEEIDRIEEALNNVQDAVVRLDEADRIEDRAKHSKSVLRRSESVTVSLEDYNKLISGYRYAANLEVRCNQLEQELQSKEREIESLKRKISYLERKADEHGKEFHELHLKFVEVNRKWFEHEKLLNKIKYWILGKGKQWQQEMDDIIDEFISAKGARDKEFNEMMRASNGARKVQRKIDDMSR